MSAFACEPFKGSEPEVGWQWALQMARFHDVTVLTQSKNQAIIESTLKALDGKEPAPRFVYHSLSPLVQRLRGTPMGFKMHYVLWQRSARRLIAFLHEEHQFDLLHHVTFAAFRYPVAVWGHGVPCIWGPVGGIESIPRSLLPWRHPLSLFHEVTRNTHNLIQAAPYHVLPGRARASTVILATTREMHEAFGRLGCHSQLMPTIGIKTTELPYSPHRRPNGPLKLLFVGNIITLKGIDLAIEALKESGSGATFTLVGTGNYLASARKLAAKLGMEGQVTFVGRLPLDQVLKIYPDYDLFIFPSLHDTGGYAVIEAMFNELPVICLDCGGPAVAVRAGCGVKVSLGPRGKVISDLAAAIRFYHQNRGAILEQGQTARATVLQHYDWDRKGEQMDECYQLAVSRAGIVPASTALSKPTWIESLVRRAQRVVSFKSVAISLLGLLLMGAVGIVALRDLKQRVNEIVVDTLPGLTYAGDANASLAQAYNLTLMLLYDNEPEERKRLLGEIDDCNHKTTQYLNAYRDQIFCAEDQVLFDALLIRRKEYLGIRREVFALVGRQQSAQALALYRSQLLPAYASYREAGDRLFAYNVHQGQTRGRHITAVCSTTEIVVGAVAIVLFLAGLLIGIFK
jgi:glycosyltransferase involved in cell wall biosynthesis